MTSTNNAFAVSLGFIQFPDWMLPYIVSLFFVFGVSWIGVWLTKPKEVPFNQLFNVELSPLANVFHHVAVISFIAALIFLFSGMFMTLR